MDCTVAIRLQEFANFQDGHMKNFVGLVIFTILFTGCGNKKKSEDLNGFVSKPDNSSCQNAQIKNQFVVVWKDGSITREYSRDREGFVKQFMGPNEDQIQFAEHDYYVEQLTGAGKDSGLGGPSSFSDWGLVNIEATSLWQRGILGQGIKVAVIDLPALVGGLVQPKLTGSIILADIGSGHFSQQQF
jgi:hypothetical protein